MSAEMNARVAEKANQIIDELDERVRWLEMQLAELRPKACKVEKLWTRLTKVTDLNVGDVVRIHGWNNEPFLVVQVYGNHAVVSHTQEVTNPCEWEVLR